MIADGMVGFSMASRQKKRNRQMQAMFEKPKTLNELSEYELQNLVSYLAGEWEGRGP